MPKVMLVVLTLAVVQGLTEFLPVSSSGHLVLIGRLVGIREPGAGSGIMVEIAVHVGTLFAIVVHYRRRLGAVLGALRLWVSGGFALREGTGDEVSYAGLVLLGNVPAVLVGLLFHDRVTAAFEAPAVASACLVATGLFLLAGRGRGGDRALDWRIALLVGAAQAIAILPGCSRSGWTITTALLLGLGFERAAEFSFLMSIPAILGALLLEIVKNPSDLGAAGLPALGMGALVAFASGYAALRILVGMLGRGHFHRFSYYLLPVGTAALLYFTLAA